MGICKVHKKKINKVKVSYTPPGGVLLLPLDGMLVRPRATPSSTSPVPFYTPGWREKILKNGRDWASNH